MGIKLLQVETALMSDSDVDQDPNTNVLDYRVYSRVPRIWRRLEKWLRLDLYLAYRTRCLEKDYDVVWALSEQVAIPLSFMWPRKPLVVTAHHMESPLKAKLARYTGIARRWSGIGYISNESKKFFMDDLEVDEARLFQYETAKYLNKVNVSETSTEGPIISAGVAKRDYDTLIAALSDLEGYTTDLFVSSKFGDELARRISQEVPNWVRFRGYVPDQEILDSYRNCRFAVIPLTSTTHNGAGINVALEAAACGKAVVATDTGGMRTFVKDGETGILVPANDKSAMKEAIRKLWTQPDLARRMGLAGRQYVESQYKPEVVAQSISTFLNRIVAPASLPARPPSRPPATTSLT